MLVKRGSIRSYKLVDEFAPMTGFLEMLWLDGHYKQAILWLKANKSTPGKVEAIRLVIGGRIQRRTLSASSAEWEQYAKHILPTEASKHIDGFYLRIRTNK